MADPTLRLVPLDEAHLPRILEIEAEANAAPWSERSFRNELGDANGRFRVALIEMKPPSPLNWTPAFATDIT